MEPLRIFAVLLACVALVYGYGANVFKPGHWSRWGALSSMLLLAWLAVWPVTVERRAPIVELQASNIEHRTPIAAAFVASSIQKEGKKAYHVPACYYAKRITHAIDFATESQATAAGYRPCSECITPRLAGLK